jgi:hypothetical protein
MNLIRLDREDAGFAEVLRHLLMCIMQRQAKDAGFNQFPAAAWRISKRKQLTR